VRILVLTNMYPPHHLGGYELWCADVVGRWRSSGHEVRVLVSDLRSPGVTISDDPGVRRDLRWYWKDHAFVVPPITERLSIERSNHRVLRDELARFRPDVVSVWHMGGMSLGLLTTVTRAGIPMVFVVHDDWLTYAKGADPWTGGFARHPRLRALAALGGVPTTVEIRSDEVGFCFVSDYIRRRAPDDWPIARSAVIPSGIDLAGFPARPSLPPWRWRLVCAGRVERRKGVHVAVEALRHLPPETTLDVIGPSDDAYAAELRAIAEDVGASGRLSFGTVPRAELAARYADADVLLFPVVWDEPWGLVPIEAMATGTPVVATGTGGSAEFLEDGGNCLLVPPDDAEAIADAVRRLAGDEPLRERLVDGGRRTAARFEASALAADLERWHLAAVKGFAIEPV
jgi:glycosyltransferase involved in cell wall biosynthesis